MHTKFFSPRHAKCYLLQKPVRVSFEASITTCAGFPIPFTVELLSGSCNRAL